MGKTKRTLWSPSDFLNQSRRRKWRRSAIADDRRLRHVQNAAVRAGIEPPPVARPLHKRAMRRRLMAGEEW